MLQRSPRLIAGILISLILLTLLFWGRRTEVVGNHVPVVLVAVLERMEIAEQIRMTQKVLENRLDYANAHGKYCLLFFGTRVDGPCDVGYELAVFNSSEYTMYSESERVWVKLAALRDAMSLYPKSEWFWYLDQVKSLTSPPVD